MELILWKCASFNKTHHLKRFHNDHRQVMNKSQLTINCDIKVILLCKAFPKTYQFYLDYWFIRTFYIWKFSHHQWQDNFGFNLSSYQRNTVYCHQLSKTVQMPTTKRKIISLWNAVLTFLILTIFSIFLNLWVKTKQRYLLQ